MLLQVVVLERDVFLTLGAHRVCDLYQQDVWGGDLEEEEGVLGGKEKELLPEHPLDYLHIRSHTVYWTERK